MYLARYWWSKAIDWEVVMRRRAVLTLVLVLGLLSAVFWAPAAAAGSGAQVIHKEAVPCDVGWSEDVGMIMTDDCWGTNVKTPNGRYVLTLHGQIPDDRMDEFDGPLHYMSGCWSNWFFVYDEGEEPAFTHSVRRFTPNGQMTEICIFSP
jgi:hypothetical protein